MEKFTLSQCVVGFELTCRARRLSENTIIDYKNTYRLLSEWLENDPPLAKISSTMIEQFLASRPVSKKTVSNYHVGLSVLWNWALEKHFVTSNIIRAVGRATPEKRAIVPFSREDIRAMFSAVNRSKFYKRAGKKESDHSLPDPDRNLAMLFLLLDTGVRATELCTLTLKDVDFRNSRIMIFGKGAKERNIPYSARTGQALWKYSIIRRADAFSDAFFLTGEGRALDRYQLYHRIQSIADRAQVNQFNPHRFRHTFAINYLRNGGDPYTLQILLGHSSMDMVSRYLAIAQVDLDLKHRRASPVENWRL